MIKSGSMSWSMFKASRHNLTSGGCSPVGIGNLAIEAQLSIHFEGVVETDARAVMPAGTSLRPCC